MLKAMTRSPCYLINENFHSDLEVSLLKDEFRKFRELEQDFVEPI